MNNVILDDKSNIPLKLMQVTYYSTLAPLKILQTKYNLTHILQAGLLLTLEALCPVKKLAEYF